MKTDELCPMATNEKVKTFPHVVAGLRAEQTGTIYFIGGKRGPVKIGFTTNLRQRLVRIQACSPIWLTVLASVENCSPVDESRYHSRFGRERLHGEWFQRSPELEAEIKKLKRSDAPIPGHQSRELP